MTWLVAASYNCVSPYVSVRLYLSSIRIFYVREFVLYVRVTLHNVVCRQVFIRTCSGTATAKLNVQFVEV